MENTAKKISSHTVVDIFEKFEHFSKVMIDAYVLVDAEGRILKSNLLFSQLVGQKIKQILKSRSFDDLITMEVNDQFFHLYTVQQASYNLRKFTGPSLSSLLVVFLKVRKMLICWPLALL